MSNDRTDTIVSARGLSAGYRNKLLWHDAHFEIKRGEFVGLLGPNGAGKTTLFKLILGLLHPTEGELHIFGKSPHRGNRRVGYIPQRRPIDTELRIEALEFVRLGLTGTRWGMSTPSRAAVERTKAAAALAKVDAAELANRSLGELSGGELQRIFLAQALIGEPDVLLLDEPLANLDIRRGAELIQVVSKVAKAQNVAVLLIAHDINPLLRVVDRLIYVVNGRVATGKPHEIITTEGLSALYGAPVEVLRDSHGRVAVLGTEEATHHV